MRITGWVALWLSILATASRAHDGDAGMQPYSLDGLERVVDAAGAIRCPAVPMLVHSGKLLKWRTPIKIYEGFLPSIVGLEGIINSIAERVYGRAPKQIRHLGSYNCRRIRLYPTLLSEHGIANAIDVEGFDFEALSPSQRDNSRLPKALQRRFTTTILEHWNGPEEAGNEAQRAAVLHRRFWRELADELAQRPDLFRVVLGPAYPGHKNHLHLDMAPYRLVNY